MVLLLLKELTIQKLIDNTVHNNSFKSIEYTIHMDDSDNNQSQINKLLLTYNKTDVFTTEYATISSNNDLGSITADVAGNIIRVRVTKSAGTGNLQVNSNKTIIK
jgi:hypothetical protein